MKKVFYNLVLLCGMSTAVWAQGMAPMSVNFYNVKVNAQRDNVGVRWVATHDNNTSHYELERSLDGLDYDVVDGSGLNGGINTQHQYLAVDWNPVPNEQAFYRVKAVGHGGQVKYSSIKEYEFVPYDPMTAVNASLAMYPNPSTGSVILSSHSANIQQVKVFDLTGKEVDVNVDTQFLGKKRTINLTDAPNGHYFVKVSSQGNVQTLPLIINK